MPGVSQLEVNCELFRAALDMSPVRYCPVSLCDPRHHGNLPRPTVIRRYSRHVTILSAIKTRRIESINAADRAMKLIVSVWRVVGGVVGWNQGRNQGWRGVGWYSHVTHVTP